MLPKIGDSDIVSGVTRNGMVTSTFEGKPSGETLTLYVPCTTCAGTVTLAERTPPPDAWAMTIEELHPVVPLQPLIDVLKQTS
jgi:hypothetical protein